MAPCTIARWITAIGGGWPRPGVAAVGGLPVALPALMFQSSTAFVRSAAATDAAGTSPGRAVAALLRPAGSGLVGSAAGADAAGTSPATAVRAAAPRLAHQRRTLARGRDPTTPPPLQRSGAGGPWAAALGPSLYWLPERST